MQNKLIYLSEFQNILSNYRISDQSARILRKVNLVLMVAPTSAGRNTIIRELMKTGEYYFIVSDTTRLPRINDGVPEKNGVEYWFRKEEDMLNDLKSGKFLEAAIIHDQQVSGISMRELDKAARQNKIAITDIEIVGVENIMRVKSDAHPIFVLPPSFEEWQHRLKHRGKMTREETLNRMRSAVREFQHALESGYYTFVINKDIEAAAQEINLAARYGMVDDLRQAEGRKLAEQLLLATKSYLHNTP